MKSITVWLCLVISLTGMNRAQAAALNNQASMSKKALPYKIPTKPYVIPNFLPLGTNMTLAKLEAYRLTRVNRYVVGFDIQIDPENDLWEGQLGWGTVARFPEGTTFTDLAQLSAERNRLLRQFWPNLKAYLMANPSLATHKLRFHAVMDEEHAYTDGTKDLAAHFYNRKEFYLENGELPEGLLDHPLEPNPTFNLYIGPGVYWMYDRKINSGGNESGSVFTYQYDDPYQVAASFSPPWYKPSASVIYGKNTVDYGTGPVTFHTKGWLVFYFLQPDGSYRFAKYHKENGERVPLELPRITEMTRTGSFGETTILRGTGEKNIILGIESAETLFGPWEFEGNTLTFLSEAFQFNAHSASAHRFYRVSQIEMPWLF